jgi:hypothetical protein
MELEMAGWTWVHTHVIGLGVSARIARIARMTMGRIELGLDES